MIIKKTSKWFGKAFDLVDLIGFGGLGMVFYGFYIWKPFIAYIVVGFIILFLCITASLENKNPKSG